MRQVEGVGVVKKFLRFVAPAAVIVVFACKLWGSTGAGDSAEIIGQYLNAETHAGPRAGSMDVEISASVPQLKKQGQLHASRRISTLGRISYHVLGFEGDKAVKNQVIARYLDAERQAHDNETLAVTPTNYKFKFKGERAADGDRPVYVFDLIPRKKRVGLFKGEIWLDPTTFLPVYEKGRFVKNPSVFFKGVQFERAYEIRNGIQIPEHTNSTINTRLVGRVELNVKYSNFAVTEGAGGGFDPGLEAAGTLQ
jgi:hypothetical protein